MPSEKIDREDRTFLNRSIQSRINRQHGVNWERFMCRKLREAGFTVQRVNESDGYSKGVDFQIFDTPWGRIPCQAKKSLLRSYLLKGLKEVRSGAPRAPLVACFLGHYARGNWHTELSIAINRFPSPPAAFELISLQEFIMLARDNVSALLAGSKYATLPSNGIPR